MCAAVQELGAVVQNSTNQDGGDGSPAAPPISGIPQV